MRNLTIEQIKNARFEVRKEPILKPFGLSFVVADPSLLTPDLSPDGRWHMFFHTTVEGVFHFSSEDGVHFTKVQRVVKNAMRPNINKIGEKYYLFYERTRSVLANGLSVLNLAKWRSHIAVTVSDDLVHWSKPKAVITDAHGYETNERGKSISNPFLLPVGDKFRLYFSCGLTFIPDCGFCEPTYIGYAESDSPDGGFVVAKDPVLSPDPTSEYFNLCSGCLKVYAVKDGYIGVQNGLYENDGRSHSAILLLSSPDGLRFTVENMMVEPNEADEKSWMHQFVYASHLVKDQNALRLYFNARDTADMLKGRECIGFAEATIAE